MFLFINTLNQCNVIEGWLDVSEADLLMSTALKAGIELPTPHNFVEVGSYQGKSTVVLGSVVKNFFPTSKVYAIDPHEGIIGAEGHDLQSVNPTLEAFMRNIANNDLSSHVQLIQQKSYEVEWNEPISLLFIDGLHDYPNVSRDFYHFQMTVRKNGYILFHDYIAYYPGVVNFVNELLETNLYKEICVVRSMILVQYVGEI